jgi:hypothetical protein
MESGANQKVGGKVKDYNINVGDFIANVHMYVITLGYYDVMIRMYWLESHEAILNCKMKRLNLIDDLG